MKPTESNTPVLKYLGWGKSLREHPDFQNKAMGIMRIKDYDNTGPHDKVVNDNLTEHILRDWPALANSFRKNIRTVDTNLFRKLLTCRDNNALDGVPVRTSLQGTLLADGLSVCYDMMVTRGRQLAGILIVLQGETLRLVCSGNNMKTTFASREMPLAEKHITLSELTERLSRAVAALHLGNNHEKLIR